MLHAAGAPITPMLDTLGGGLALDLTKVAGADPLEPRLLQPAAVP
jgi:hypothetical protein